MDGRGGAVAEGEGFSALAWSVSEYGTDCHGRGALRLVSGGRQIRVLRTDVSFFRKERNYA